MGKADDKVVKTDVPRKAGGMNKEQLKEHIRGIGQAIIDDAERIASFIEDGLYSIEVKARIEPASLTTVQYRLHRSADPRINR